MRTILAVLLALFILNAKAQTINGYVLSSEDNKPVEYANILLLQLPDSSFQSGVITYSDGKYELENVKAGKYYIKCSFVGFEDNGTIIEVPDEIGTYLADTIYMSENAEELGTVDVVGDKIQGKELVDRTVYNIPPAVAKSSTNGFEILRKIPSVQVDFNNNVTLEGKSNFIIQVDGKQRDKEYLARLLPEDIESVEVITNPSGKYDASIDGVINIKLTKEARVGINGNISGMVRPAKKPSGYVAGGLDYGREKITFYVSGYSFFQGLDNNTTSYSRYMIPAKADSIIDSKGTGDFGIVASSVSTGFDYRINDKNTLSLNVSYKPNTMSTELENNGNIYNNNLLTNFQDYTTSNKTNSDETNASLFYKKEFKKPIQELTAEATWYLFNSTNNNDFVSNLYGDNHDIPDTSIFRNEKAINERTYMSAKVDYVHPIGVSMRLETGYQIYYQSLNYDFNSSDAALSNVYDYSEFRNAAYLGWTWNVKKFGLQATLRAEYSDIKVSDAFRSDYFTLLPSTNIQYKISGSQNIKLNYNRRINRPDIYNLNPFERISPDFNISKGNPFLEPEHRDKVELKYTLNFGKNYFSPAIYYEHISKKISTLNNSVFDPITGREFTISSPENVLTGYETGVGINTMLWFLNINGSVFKGYYNEFNGQSPPIESRDYFSYRVTSYAFAPLFKKKVNVFAFVSYNGVRVDAQSKTYSTPFYGFGAQMNGKKHSFGFFYFLPFKSDLNISETIIETPAYYSKSINSFDVSYYTQIQYSYKFNKGKSIKKLKRDAEIESDTKGGGIGR
ncbi:MAG: TonB-dependent receptor [Bacteroidales bacterium]|nr:TonB-dependent receptor [Bacteroidales bacterium]